MRNSVSALAGRIAARDPLISAHALGRALLCEEPHAARLGTAETSTLVDAALIDGAMLAEQIRQSWGEEPERIAAVNAVPVFDSDANAGYGTTLVFAHYQTRPLGILLYRPVIARLDSELRQSGIGRLLGIDSTRAVFLAHELYHHFDEARARPLCSRHRAPVLSIGRLRVTAAIAGMREIAAGAFAQQLLGSTFHPRLLELAAVAFAQRRAEHWLASPHTPVACAAARR
jgi:hypothetical protein